MKIIAAAYETGRISLSGDGVRTDRAASASKLKAMYRLAQRNHE